MRYVYFHGFASSPLSRKAQAFASAFSVRGLTLEIPTLDAGNFENLTLSGQLQIAEDLLQGDPACLIGSSMGGYLATLYASMHPEVPRVVLLAPAFSFSARWEQLLGPEKLRQWEETEQLEVFHYGEKRNRTLGYSLFTDALTHPPFPDAPQPCRIFHGANDDIVPIELSRQFIATHPNAALHELPSDHELLDVLDAIVTQSMPFLTGR